MWALVLKMPNINISLEIRSLVIFSRLCSRQSCSDFALTPPLPAGLAGFFTALRLNSPSSNPNQEAAEGLSIYAGDDMDSL